MFYISGIPILITMYYPLPQKINMFIGFSPENFTFVIILTKANMNKVTSETSDNTY